MFKIKSLENHIDTILQHLFFLLLLLFCIAYYRERILIYDTSFYLFNIIKNGNFFIPHGRYAIVITQILPLLAIKLGLPLKIVMKAFSLNVGLFYYALYLLIRYTLKDKFGGWLLIFSFALFAQTTYFYTVSEIQIGLAFIIFVILFLNNRILKDIQTYPLFFYILLFSLFLIVGWLHFFIYIPLGMILGYIFITHYKTHPKIVLISIALFLAAFIFHYLNIRLSGGYQTIKLLNFHQIKVTIKELWHNTDPKNWIEQYMPWLFYHDKTYIALAVAGVLLYKKKYLTLLFAVCCIITISVVFLASIPNDYPPAYKESYANVWGILCIAPVFIDSNWGISLVKSVLLLVLLSLSIWRSEDIMHKSSARIRAMRSFVQEMRDSKISKGYILHELKYESAWSHPYETLLYSSTTPPSLTCLLTSTPPDSSILNQKNIFIGAPWEANIPIKDLPTQYFQLDTITPYQKIP